MFWYNMMWYAMFFVQRHLVNITNISNLPCLYLHMFRQYDIKFTIWPCHYSFQVQSPTHPIGKRAQIYKWQSTVACSMLKLKQSNMPVLKNWLARNKLQKIRTHHAESHKVVLVCSKMLNLLCCCSTHSDSLWCFLSWWVGTNDTLTAPIPAWKNMPMMAIIASLPFAISALSFLVFSAGSAAVNTLNPKSPAYASVPGVCSWETSQKAM